MSHPIEQFISTATDKSRTVISALTSYTSHPLPLIKLWLYHSIMYTTVLGVFIILTVVSLLLTMPLFSVTTGIETTTHLYNTSMFLLSEPLISAVGLSVLYLSAIRVYDPPGVANGGVDTIDYWDTLPIYLITTTYPLIYLLLQETGWNAITIGKANITPYIITTLGLIIFLALFDATYIKWKYSYKVNGSWVLVHNPLVIPAYGTVLISALIVLVGGIVFVGLLNWELQTILLSLYLFYGLLGSHYIRKTIRKDIRHYTFKHPNVRLWLVFSHTPLVFAYTLLLTSKTLSLPVLIGAIIPIVIAAQYIIWRIHTAGFLARQKEQLYPYGSSEGRKRTESIVARDHKETSISNQYTRFYNLVKNTSLSAPEPATAESWEIGEVVNKNTTVIKSELNKTEQDKYETLRESINEELDELDTIHLTQREYEQ